MIPTDNPNPLKRSRVLKAENTQQNQTSNNFYKTGNPKEVHRHKDITLDNNASQNQSSDFLFILL